MANFYYNGTAAQGTEDGSSAANASNTSSAAIVALSGGVEVTAGIFSLTAAQASGYTITGAGTVSISDPVTVAQANSLVGNIAATLSLSSISDTSANLAGSGDAVLGLATTVTASTTATAAQATTIGGFTKAVTYSISDTATLVAGAGTTALNEAVNITATESATVAQTTLLAQTVDLAATSAGSTSSRGLFSSAASALPVNLSENGRISAIAQQSSFSQSIPVNGTASSSLSNDSLGIGNALITVGAAGSLDVRAISLLDNRAQSVTSAARA